MLHRQLTSRFKEVRHLRWVGISPFKASTCLDPAFKQGSHRLALPSARFAIAPAAFQSLPSAGGAQSRCTRTVFAEQVVMHRAVFERSLERFRVGIRALEDARISDRVNGNTRAG